MFRNPAVRGVAAMGTVVEARNTASSASAPVPSSPRGMPSTRPLSRRPSSSPAALAPAGRGGVLLAIMPAVALSPSSPLPPSLPLSSPLPPSAPLGAPSSSSAPDTSKESLPESESGSGWGSESESESESESDHRRCWLPPILRGAR